MDKENRKVKGIFFQVNTNMDKKNQAYINIMAMFMRANLLMVSFMVKEN